MKMSESIKNLAAAMSKFQGELGAASKSKANPFFKSKYADIAEIWETIKEPLAANGLSVVQLQGTNVNGDPTLSTTVMHSSGEYITSETPLIFTKKEPQAIGSAVTYFRRYGLAAALGVVQDDDDASATTTAPPPKLNIKRPTQKRDDQLIHEQDKTPCHEFVIPIGSAKGKKFADIGAEGCERFLKYVQGEEKKRGFIDGPMLLTKKKAEEYLNSITGP